MDKDINITLKVWRQKGPNVKGQFETYQLKNINQGTSFLGNVGYPERAINQRR